MSHTVVSKHILGLEHELGVALLKTGPNGVALTAEGRRYYEQIASALQLISDATSELQERRGYPTLHIASSPGFAITWLTPRISCFLQQHPGIEITIRPTDRPPDLLAGEADVDIRYTDRRAVGTTCEEFLRPRVFPVASPRAHFAQPGIVRSLSDLLAQPLVHEETHAHWQLWLNAAGLSAVEIPPGSRYWNAPLAIEAARMGHGIALALDLLVEEDLRSGRLVELLETDVRLHTYAIATRADRWHDTEITCFREWLLAACRAS